MKKSIAILMLVLAMSAAPVLAQAQSFTWDTPYWSGSVSSDDVTQNGSTEGSGVFGSIPFTWGFTWDVPSQTAGADLTYGDDAYSFTASFADIFAALFGF